MDDKVKIGSYSFYRKNIVGSGGMANVYQDYHPVFKDTRIAIKEIRPYLLDAISDIRERFISEAKYAITLRHENIVAVYDVLDIDNRLYIVMDYVDGSTLKSEIESDGPMQLEKVGRIITNVARALDYIHSNNCIHRDVKSSNIMIRKADNKVLLMDFGIIKNLDAPDLTKGGEQLGTPEYMSPEQAKGERPTIASDIYALGIVAYEMLTGTVPFKSETPAVTLVKHITDSVPTLHETRPNLPFWVISAVDRALSKNPHERFASAGDFASALCGESHHTTRMSADRVESKKTALLDTDTPADYAQDTATYKMLSSDRIDKLRVALTVTVVMLFVLVAGLAGYIFINRQPVHDNNDNNYTVIENEIKSEPGNLTVSVSNDNNGVENTIDKPTFLGENSESNNIIPISNNNTDTNNNYKITPNIKSIPDPSHEFFQEAKDFFNAGMYLIAIPLFKKAMDQNPGLASECNLRIGLSHYNYVKSTQTDRTDTDYHLRQAIEHFTKVLERDPNHGIALFRRASSRVKLKKEFLEARDDLNAYTKEYGYSYDVYILLAELSMTTGETDEIWVVITNYQLAISSSSDYEKEQKPAFYELMRIGVKFPSHRTRVRDYLKDNQTLKKSPDYYYLLGELDFADKDWDSAIGKFEKTIEMQPNHTAARNSLAVAKQKKAEATHGDN